MTCDELGTITVSVQRGENANGAGQLVEATGHGIPVAATLTLTDLTSSTVLASETTATGQGNGHPTSRPRVPVWYPRGSTASSVQATIYPVLQVFCRKAL